MAGHAHSAWVWSAALLASAQLSPRYVRRRSRKAGRPGGSSERRRGAALYPFRRSTSRGAPFSVWELPDSGSICSADGHGIRHRFGTAAACSPRLECLATAWSGRRHGGAGVGAAQPRVSRRGGLPQSLPGRAHAAQQATRPAEFTGLELAAPN